MLANLENIVLSSQFWAEYVKSYLYEAPEY